MAELISVPRAEDLYDEMLDECNEMVRIGILEYTPSQVLKEVDPIAYREGFLEYVNYLVEDGIFVTGCSDEMYPGPDEDEEAASAHGGQPLKRGSDPVFLRDGGELERVGDAFTSGRGDEFPDPVLIRLISEIDFHQPRQSGPAFRAPDSAPYD